MLRLNVALCFLTACLAQNLQKTRLLFNEYKQQYQKTYSGAENEYRLQVFSENLDFINRHNEEADRGLHTYRCGVNKYADMSHEEFVRVMLGFRHNANATYTNKLYVPQISDEALPAEVDWRKKGFVTHIKDQGQCGSCWAFSATGSLEGQHYNRTKKLVSLSEQNLVDCSQKEGNMGCLGGLMDQAFKYIKTNHGIDTEKSYPYKAEDEKCRFKKGEVGATLKSWRDIPKGSEKALEKAVAEVGPISVAIDASQTSFQLYSTGVYNEPACSKDVLDHGVLAIGYGVEKSKDFWLVKNSWGTSWGEEGYIKMSRNKNNQCGIATEASHPVV